MSLIECRGICKDFGNKRVLNNIDLTIEAGGPVGIVGPNGAGKTTFFSIVSGFIHASAGSVTVLGEDPQSDKIKRRFSVLPQDALFPKSTAVIKTLKFFAELQGMSSKEASREAAQVLEMVGLASSGNFYPDKLSHGMKKRLSIAQALIGKPELILLDEPTSGLDPTTASNVRSIIAERAKDATFLISSHNLEEIEDLCESILVFNRGQLIKQEKVDSLVARRSALTISLDNAATPELLNLLTAIPGVMGAQNPEPKIVAVTFAEEQANEIQMAVMKCLLDSNTGYREIKKGQSLEKQLVQMTK